MPSDDPLGLAGLDPAKIEDAIKKKKEKPMNPLEISKEKRLQEKEQRIASGGVKFHAPPAAPPPAVTQEVDKSALLDKILAYRERFPHLKKRNNVTVKSATEDIVDELHYCEMQLGSRNDGSLGAMLLHGTMVAVESVHRDIWNPMGLNLNGLGKVTKDSMHEFEPLLDEMMIKYGTGMSLCVEARLALAVGATMVTVHAANSGDPRIAAALQKMHTPVQVPAGSGDL